MIRLEEGLYSWGYFNREKQYNFNGFLVAEGGHCVVVDPPPPGPDDEAYLSKLGLWPELVVITNRNHLRGRGWFAQRKPIPTAMHRLEAPQVDVPVERVLEDGEALPCGLRAVHLPGKSPGEIALYHESRRYLIVGDALIAPYGGLKLIPEAKLDDAGLLRRSLQRLRTLEFDAVYLADGDPITRGAKAKVAAFLDGLPAAEARVP